MHTSEASREELGNEAQSEEPVAGPLTLVSDSALALLELLRTEAQLALKQIPMLCTLWLFKLLLLSLIWISASASAGWWTAQLLGHAGFGFAVFFLLQAFAWFWLQSKIERSKRLMRFEVTREEYERFSRLLSEAMHEQR